jgi:hypothetical protein
MDEDEATALIMELIPDLSKEDASNILWCCTGWPNFFPFGKSMEECLRGEIRGFLASNLTGKI